MALPLPVLVVPGLVRREPAEPDGVLAGQGCGRRGLERAEAHVGGQGRSLGRLERSGEEGQADSSKDRESGYTGHCRPPDRESSSPTHANTTTPPRRGAPPKLPAILRDRFGQASP